MAIQSSKSEKLQEDFLAIFKPVSRQMGFLDAVKNGTIFSRDYGE